MPANPLVNAEHLAVPWDFLTGAGSDEAIRKTASQAATDLAEVMVGAWAERGMHRGSVYARELRREVLNAIHGFHLRLLAEERDLARKEQEVFGA